jgi:membrane protease YdiL (CAAX protease family)
VRCWIRSSCRAQRPGSPGATSRFFTILAYGFAWALFLPLVPNIFDLLTADRTPSELGVSKVFVLGMFAPTAAAVVMRLFVSKEGLKGSLGPLRVWRFYGLALLIPAIVVALVIGIDELTGWGEFTWDETLPIWLAYPAVGIGALFLAVLTFGEEYGWRGYLLPKLLPLGEVKAAVIVGLIWGLWHAPLLLAGLNFTNVNPLASIGLFLVAPIAISLIFTRMYVAAGGAVLVAAVVHGSFNAYSDFLATPDHLSGNQLVVTPRWSGGNRASVPDCNRCTHRLLPGDEAATPLAGYAGRGHRSRGWLKRHSRHGRSARNGDRARDDR